MSKKISESSDEKLTVQQRMFVKHMKASKNMKPSDAAREAGYSHPNIAAAKLMKNPLIKESLVREVKEREHRLDVKGDEILSFLHNVLLVDVTEIFDDDGFTTMKQIKALPKYVRMCIQGIESETVYHGTGDDMVETDRIKVKWMSKDKALELALKHHGMLQPDLHLHVHNDEVKARVLMEMLEGVSSGKVIDAEHVEKLADKRMKSE